MNDVIVVHQSAEVVDRADVVRVQLTQVKAELEAGFIELCYLLRETQKNSYHHAWGYSNFESWVEASGLDLSPRQAYYYLSIAGKAEKLGLTREDLATAKVSKLKEIFTLDPAEYGKEMKQLVAAAATDKLQVISDKIEEIRRRDGKPKPGTYAIKLNKEIRETQEKAFELARMNYGEVMDPITNASKDASDSQCLELICASYIQDVSNYPEGVGLADLADVDI